MDSTLLTPEIGYSPPVNRVAAVPSTNGDLRKQVTDQAFGSDGFLLPPYRTFSGIINLFSKVYSFRFDEALRHAPQNAQAMRHDAYFAALIEERIKPLSQWKYQIEIDEDDKGQGDGQDDKREEVRSSLESIVRRTHKWAHMREYLPEFVWTGKYGAQVVWGNATIGGKKRKAIVNHSPVDGDKILIDFDGNPAVGIYGVDMSNFPREDVGFTDRFPVLKLNQPHYRQRFIIPQFHLRDGDYFDPTSAGRVGGVGLRHYAYWAWWLRDEMLSWVADFMEKVGSLGILIFYYDQHNVTSKANAIAAAKAVGNGNALAVPIPSADPRVGSVDVIPANLNGVQFLTQFIGDYFESHIERLIVGQKLSSDSKGAGGFAGGEGAAGFQMNTKYILLASDAELLSECLTEDLVAVAKELNFPDCPWKYHFKFIVPDPASDKKLEAVSKARSLGVDFEEDGVRELTGMPKPAEGARTLDDIEKDKQQAQAALQQQAATGEATTAALRHPEALQHAPELVKAMLHVGDNPDALQKLAGLANDQDQLNQIAVGAHDGDQSDNNESLVAEKDGDEANDGATAHYSWTPATTKGGKVKAVGAAEHEGRTLYGKEAERALANQGKTPAADEPSQPKQPGAGEELTNKAPKGQDAGAKPAKEAPHDTAMRIVKNAENATAEDIQALAMALPKIPLAKLKAMRFYDNPTADKTKDQIVRSLVSWATQTRQNADMRKTQRTAREDQAKAGASEQPPPLPESAKQPPPLPKESKADTEEPTDVEDATAVVEPSPVEGEAPHAVYDHFHDALASSSHLKPGQRQHYQNAITTALNAMPAKAHDRIAKHVSEVGFHENPQALGEAAVDAALLDADMSREKLGKLQGYLSAFKSGKLKPGAAYQPKTGRIHLDGDLSGDYQAHEVYAHALGHAIDGPKKEISGSPEWQEAWKAEIRGGGLNKYATKTASEGMAEFCRLVYGGGAEKAKASFPKAYAAFEKHGLLEGDTADQTATLQSDSGESQTSPTLPTGSVTSGAVGDPQEPVTTGTPSVVLPDVFAERAALDDEPDGAHVDTIRTSPDAGGEPEQAERGNVFRPKAKDLEGMQKELAEWHAANFATKDSQPVSDEAKAHAGTLEEHFPQEGEDDSGGTEPTDSSGKAESVPSRGAGAGVGDSGVAEQGVDNAGRSGGDEEAAAGGGESGDSEYPAANSGSDVSGEANVDAADNQKPAGGVPQEGEPDNAKDAAGAVSGSHVEAMRAIPLGKEGEVNGHKVLRHADGETYTVEVDGKRRVVTSDEAAGMLGKSEEPSKPATDEHGQKVVSATPLQPVEERRGGGMTRTVNELLEQYPHFKEAFAKGTAADAPVWDDLAASIMQTRSITAKNFNGSGDQAKLKQLASEQAELKKKLGIVEPTPKPVTPYSKATKDDYNHHDFTNSHEHWNNNALPNGHVGITIKGTTKGHRGNEQAYIAKLVGTDPQYDFKREFVPGVRLKPGEKLNTSLGEDGLYEVQTGAYHGNAPERHYLKVEKGKTKEVNRHQAAFHLPTDGPSKSDLADEDDPFSDKFKPKDDDGGGSAPKPETPKGGPRDTQEKRADRKNDGQSVWKEGDGMVHFAEPHGVQVNYD